MSSEKVKQPYMQQAWFMGLKREVDCTSIADVARRLNLSRPSISQVINGCGPYGTGKASLTSIEVAYLREFEQITCPHTQMQVGADHCRGIALRNAPSHNPLAMQHWQACQRCAFRPKPVVAAPLSPAKPHGKDSEPPQQAGIIDKVTLPLPVVGGPQVEITP